MRRRRSIRTMLVLALSVFLMAVVGACGKPDVGATVDGGTATVGVIPIVDVAPLYLGIQKEFFSKRGLTIQPKPAQGGAYIIPIVLSEQCQVGFSNVVSLLGARDRGIGLVSVAGGSSSTGDIGNDSQAVMVGPGSNLRTARDLVGRTVAVNGVNSVLDITTRAAVAEDGGDPTKVTFEIMPFPDMIAQLEQGHVDAALLTEPFRTALLAKGGRVLFNNLPAVHPPAQISQWFVTDTMRQQDPELVAAFTEGIKESHRYATQHPDEVRSILPTYMNITPEVAAKVVLPAWPSDLNVESTLALGRRAKDFGTLKNAPDVNGLFGSS